MISDEQRREVAALLRKEADGWAEDCPDTVTCESYDYYEFILNIADSADIDLSKPPSMLFDRLADLIDRPTCRKLIPDEMEGLVFCSNCGAEIGEYGVPNYCHNCGAEVVE